MGVVGVYLCTLSVRPPPLHRYLFMNELIQTFNFDDDFVRVVVDDTNNPLFVAKDVATVLGYARTTDAINQHCKGAVNHRPLSTKGGTQEMRVIAEPDVYRLVFGSKLETAERFQDWVFNEVLPQIRRTGAYEVQPPIPTDPLLLIAHLAQSAYEIQQKQSEMDNRLIKVEQKQQQLDQDNDHFTIKGFCSLHGLDLSNGKMSAMSKKAKKLSEAKDYAYHEISDPRFGKVKTYHVDILTELFQMQNLI